MKHVKTLNKANLKESAVKGGCGECQTSCQSACKTSCTVANQKCEHAELLRSHTLDAQNVKRIVLLFKLSNTKGNIYIDT